MSHVKNNRRSTSKQHAARWYSGANVPKSVIRRFAREVAERFHPQKIVLFGSHAYGKPHADSDVDILVVMPARNQLDQAVRISLAVDPPFPLDVIVRTPHNMKWRLAEGDSLLREIIAKGKVLYEAPDGGVGAKGRSRPSRGGKARKRKSSSA
jgi:predicted nucleotidyltransferase